MKRSVFLIVLLLVFSMICPIQANVASPAVKLIFRGEPLTLNHKPVTEAGIVLVPMKQMLDSLDAYFEYNSKTKTVSIIKDEKSLKLTEGSKNGVVNGKAVKLPIAPKLIDKQVFVPLEFVCTQLGFIYEYNKSSGTIKISDKNKPKSGNSTANISNGGFAVASGDWTYLSSYEKGLFKIKNDDSEEIKISEDSAAYINVIGSWIYYAIIYSLDDDESPGIYKMKNDGNSKTKLSKNEVADLSISGDWLYYINESDDNKPYRMRLDGKANTKLGNNSLQSMIVEDGWIYFQKEEESEIYRMRTSGADVKKLAEDGSSYLGAKIAKYGEWIYYYSTDDNYKYSINKMKLNGSDNKSVVKGKCLSFNFVDGGINYVDFSGDLYKLNAEENIRTKLGYSINGTINTANKWLYYLTYSGYLEDDYSDEEILTDEYRILSDGTIKQKHNQDGRFSDILKVATNQSLPLYTPKSLPDGASSASPLISKELAKRKDSVVHIKVFDEEKNEIATGSGFNIDESGVIATNFHVIRGASSIKCTFDNNTSYEVDYVLNYNAKKDVALIHLKDAKGLPIVKLWDSDKIELGEYVFAIGNPLQLQNTVSDGIVSGIRSILGINYVQTTASISSGSSGGPLFNEYGNVIGITTMTLSGAQNINFAIPSNYVKYLYQTAKLIPINSINYYCEDAPEFENNDSIETANELVVNQTIAGCTEDAKDVDYFKFTLEKDAKVSLFGAFNYYNDDKDDKVIRAFNMSLLNPDGTVIEKSYISIEETDYKVQKISVDLKKGTYYIAVKKTGSNSKLGEYAVITVAD